MSDMFTIAELFTSINGEGPLAGQPAVFVRFAGCNLACAYCDTAWANSPDVTVMIADEDRLTNLILEKGIKNVTLTGGEPLFRPGMENLLRRLCAIPQLHIEIETNGSIDLAPFAKIPNPPSFTMDYKLSCSGMEDQMFTDNFRLLTEKDSVKFVVGSIADCERALEIIREFDLISRCHLFFSAAFGMIDPKEIVSFMLANKCNDINLQLQMHKYIWDPDKRGV